MRGWQEDYAAGDECSAARWAQTETGLLSGGCPCHIADSSRVPVDGRRERAEVRLPSFLADHQAAKAQSEASK